MRKLFLLPGFALCAWFVDPSRAGELTVKIADKAPPAEIGEPIRKTLQPKAVELLDGDKPAFEFWFRSDLPLKSKPAAAGKALDSVLETVLVGAVSVSGGQRDYKDNEITPGAYTMRFGLQPQDGDHLGTAEFPYFAVLVPAAADTQPDGIKSFKEMARASGKNTASNHPIVLSLRPVSTDGGDPPTLQEPAAEHKSVRVKVPARAGDEKTSVVFELVCKGHGHIQ